MREKSNRLNLLRSIVFAICLMQGNTVLADAYNDGVAAYKRKDYATAFSKFKSATTFSDPLFNWKTLGSSQTYLGLMYENGQGVERNYETAAKYFYAAAMDGIPVAQTRLGLLFFEGKGVHKDYTLAYMWLNIAARNVDNATIKYRDFIEKNMTPQQISESQRMSRECVKSEFQKCD